jgi:hypothetical protein
MIRVAYIIAALLFLATGLMLWQAFGPVVFLYGIPLCN